VIQSDQNDKQTSTDIMIIIIISQIDDAYHLFGGNCSVISRE